jgi:hypothetical protein
MTMTQTQIETLLDQIMQMHIEEKMAGLSLSQ